MLVYLKVHTTNPFQPNAKKVWAIKHIEIYDGVYQDLVLDPYVKSFYTGVYSIPGGYYVSIFLSDPSTSSTDYDDYIIDTDLAESVKGIGSVTSTTYSRMLVKTAMDFERIESRNLKIDSIIC